MGSQYVSPLLYVGDPPKTVAPWIRGVRVVATPHEAASYMAQGYIAAVPSAVVAQQAMLMMNSNFKAAMYATGGYEHRWDESLGVQ